MLICWHKLTKIKIGGNVMKEWIVHSDGAIRLSDCKSFSIKHDATSEAYMWNIIATLDNESIVINICKTYTEAFNYLKNIVEDV